jgi:hypothetical protein
MSYSGKRSFGVCPRRFTHFDILTGNDDGASSSGTSLPRPQLVHRPSAVLTVQVPSKYKARLSSQTSNSCDNAKMKEEPAASTSSSASETAAQIAALLTEVEASRTHSSYFPELRPQPKSPPKEEVKKLPLPPPPSLVTRMGASTSWELSESREGDDDDGSFSAYYSRLEEVQDEAKEEEVLDTEEENNEMLKLEEKVVEEEEEEEEEGEVLPHAPLVNSEKPHEAGMCWTPGCRSAKMLVRKRTRLHLCLHCALVVVVVVVASLSKARCWNSLNVPTHRPLLFLFDPYPPTHHHLLPKRCVRVGGASSVKAVWFHVT